MVNERAVKNEEKTKNTLYEKFLREKKARNEEKDKHYKSTLTRVLWKFKKNYFEKLLLDCKGDTQNTWKTLNVLIKKKRQIQAYPQEFSHNGSLLSD